MRSMEKIQEKIKTNNDKILEYRKLINELENSNVVLVEQLDKFQKNLDQFTLNDSQKEAVHSDSQNSIIIACPGSGKTHTLVAKVSYLVNQKNINPQKIILITFTKKASQEMNERLNKYLGGQSLLHTGTIHGLAYRTMQKYYKVNFTILDDKDTHSAIYKTADEYLEQTELDDEEKGLLKKSMGYLYESRGSKYPCKIKDLVSDIGLKQYTKHFNQMFEDYQSFKDKCNYLDFNDLMIKFYHFLDEDISEEFKNSIEYILFDEFQDINNIQNEIIMKMNEKCQKLTAVGDDAQSIYAFRGSEVKYIINFNKEHNDVKTHRLEVNYRSSPEIVNFCNAIIKNNHNKLEKKMNANKNNNHIKPKITGFENNLSEVKYVVNKIKENHKIGVAYKEQVIITRTNRQLDAFELELIKNNVPYVKSKGIGILDRVHIKDFLSYLVILTNPKSLIHWKRILHMIEGLGSVSINKILSKEKPIYKRILNKDFGPKILKKIMPIYNLLTDLTSILKSKNEDRNEIVCHKIINYLTPLIKKKTKVKEKSTVSEKIEDLETLTNYLSNSGSIENFLSDIHLSIDIVKENKTENETETYLQLTTIHGSKGLEWDYVYLSGVSSNIMPNYRNNYFIDEMKEVEEERRLFYVGASRARKELELTLSYRDFYGSGNTYVSSFINELPSELYISQNLRFPEILTKGNVTQIVSNYIVAKSITDVYSLLKDIPYSHTVMYTTNLKEMRFKNEKLLGIFTDNLICKMIYQEFYELIEKFSVPMYERHSFKKDKEYHKYIDPNNDWEDNILAVAHVSIYPRSRKRYLKSLQSYISTPTSKKLFKKINKAVINLINKELSSDKPNKIELHPNVSFGEVMGEGDILINNTLIEIKMTKDCLITTRNVLQTLMYRYMLLKKGIKIKKIILFNPFFGESYELNITKWNKTTKIWKKLLEE